MKKVWIFSIYCWGALGVGAPIGSKGADEEAGEKTAEEEEVVLTQGERMEKTMKDHAERRREYFSKMREAKTAEERATLEWPDPVAAAREVLAAIRAEPDDPRARKAVIWAVRTAGRNEDVLADVIAVVKNHYLSAEGMEELCIMLVYFGGEKVVDLLEHIREKSDHKPARGAATYALGRMKMDAGDDAGAVELFNEVIDGFPDASVMEEGLAELAGREIFSIEHLEVGKVAPEIEGEKADGEDFKLSDHRGKVVVLDFFGHW